jgi:uncharacterized peroxidase-related enzyme
MPHINVSDELPGLAGLLSFKPQTAEKLSGFTQQVLRGPSPLTMAEREMIAALVSSRNECQFCRMTHTAAAAHALGDRDTVCAAIDEPETAPVTKKMRALLVIAEKVQRSGLEVTSDDVAAARATGSDDEDIHDTVLVAAVFCMYNRYVDGLAAITPTDPALYEMIGQHIAENGYA